MSRPELHRGSGCIELDEPYYGRRWLYAKGDPELLFTENETNTPMLWEYPGAARYFKDGIGEYVVHGNQGGGESRAAGHQGGGALLADARSRESPRRSNLRLDRCGRCDDPFGRSSTRSSHARADEANDFYATVTPRELSVDGARGDAAGVRRHAVVQAVLPLRGARLAEGRSQAAAAAGGAPAGPQPRVDPPLQCRRDFDAGQVGVSRGTPRGIWRSTACRWRWWIRSSPRTS